MSAQPNSVRLFHTLFIVEVFRGSNHESEYAQRTKERYCTGEDEDTPDRLLDELKELYDPATFSFALLRRNLQTHRFEKLDSCLIKPSLHSGMSSTTGREETNA